jgi:hypothetical protein
MTPRIRPTSAAAGSRAGPRWSAYRKFEASTTTSSVLARGSTGRRLTLTA